VGDIALPGSGLGHIGKRHPPAHQRWLVPGHPGLTAVPHSLAAAEGFATAGAIFASGWQATPFIVCGVLTIGYDLALLWAFRHIRPPEEMLR
jgi:hypothetical protein